MIGKPASPVRREAARKRTRYMGTSPRGRPIRLAASVTALLGLRYNQTRRQPCGRLRFSLACTLIRPSAGSSRNRF